MEIARDAPGLVGRGSVWASLTGLLDAGREVPAALLTGEAGIGKTALLEAFVAHAAKAGHEIARACGDGGGEAYGTLRELLAGLALPELPERQLVALRAALDGESQAIDLLALRAAMVTVFGSLGGALPLVVVVDDVNRADPPSFDLLLTLAAVISWRQLPVVALFAARASAGPAPADLAELLPVITVGPLSDREAERLLDTLHDSPAGGGRLELLRRAAGNPLALCEFGDTAGEIGRVFARSVRSLPAASLIALTLAATGERDVEAIARAEPGLTLADWQPAEAAGLITVTDATVRFRHPLVETAVLDAAGAAGRRHAHRALAGTSGDPRRALWHRAAAAEGTDRDLADELRAMAATLDGAAAVTAVGLLEQAAAVLPAAERAPVLVEAAERASAIGRALWAGEILDRARDVLDRAVTPALEATMTALTSWALTMRGRPAAAADLLVEAIDSGLPGVADHLLGTAAFPVFLLGRGRLADLLASAAEDVPAGNPFTLFPRAVTEPDEAVRQALLALSPPVAPAEMALAASHGAAAMLLDEPEQALRLLEPAVKAVLDATASGVFLAAPGAAAWALIDSGRWVEAEQLVVPLLSSPLTAEASLIRIGTHAQLAVIALLRGRGGVAAENEAAILDVPALAVRVRWAEALAAAAVGAHDVAYRKLLDLCATDGHGWQVLVLPDLVTAARHVGEVARAASMVERRGAAKWHSARVRGRLDAARALLTDDPGPVLARVIEGSRRWPFERAVLAVEYADRLRRAQQARAAKDVLVDALDTFERLRATSWAARVAAELRMAPPADAGADRLATLSAQQEQIVRLAAAGLSNREIGAKLFLSPRTVGSHLYRVFPLLGVANRTQLTELLSGADRHREASP